MGNAVISSAILDRLLHHNHVLNIREEICRPKEKRQAGLLPPTDCQRPNARGGPKATTATGQIGEQLPGGSILTRLVAIVWQTTPRAAFTLCVGGESR